MNEALRKSIYPSFRISSSSSKTSSSKISSSKISQQFRMSQNGTIRFVVSPASCSKTPKPESQKPPIIEETPDIPGFVLKTWQAYTTEHYHHESSVESKPVSFYMNSFTSNIV